MAFRDVDTGEWMDAVPGIQEREETPGTPPSDIADLLNKEMTVNTETGVFGLNDLEVPGDTIKHEDRMKMKRDPTVRFALLLKKFSILGLGFRIQNALRDDEEEGFEEALEVRNFVHKNLTKWIQGSFLEDLRKVLSAIDHGISITEKNWFIRDDGIIILNDLKTRERNLRDFDIHKDQHGNVETVRQQTVGEDIPLEKLIIFSYLDEGSILTGRSDLEAAWDPWFRKQAFKEFWSAYSELQSKVSVMAQLEDTDIDSDFASNIFQMLKSMQLSGRMIIPQNVEAKFAETSQGSNKSSDFFRGIKYWDSQILKAALIPPLVGEGSTERANIGSFALGKQHFNVFVLGLKYLKRRLETIVNREIVRPLVDFNFNTELYPTFKLNVLQQDTTESRANLLKMLIDAGAVDQDEDWIRPWLGIPDVEKTEVEAMTMLDELKELREKVSENGTVEKQ